MNNNYMDQLMIELEKNENVRSLIYIFNKGLKFSYSGGLNLHTLIIGLDGYDNLKNVLDSTILFKNTIISKMQEYQYKEIHYVDSKILTENGKFLNLFLLKQEDLGIFLEKYKNYEILVDKDSSVKSLEINTNKKDSWLIPDKFEFESKVVDFYIDLSEAVLSRQDEDLIKSNLKFDDLLDELLDLINVYISIKYDGNISVDTMGTNLKIYLENDYFDEFEYVVNLDRKNDFWTGVFKMSSLYRRIALHIAEKLSYEYPKEEDVRTLEFLRKLYKES